MKYWRKRKYKEKALALIIALAMVLSLFPGLGSTALATEGSAVVEAESAAAGNYPVTVGLKDNFSGNFCNDATPPEAVPATFMPGQITVAAPPAADAEAPDFDTDLSKDPVTCSVGDTAAALTVAASVTDGGTITYQWYSNTQNSSSGGSEINGATDAGYTPSTATAGTTYYYVIATNTLGDSTATAASSVACVTVNAAPIPAGPVFKVDGQPVTFENVDTYYRAYVTVHGNFTVSVDAGPDVNIASSLTGTGSASGVFTPTGTRTTVRVILQQGTAPGVMYFIYADQAPAVNPAITADLSPTVTYVAGAAADPLSVTVAAPGDEGALSYQWYSSPNNTIFTAIEGAEAQTASYTPSTAAVGTIYYKVIVTNTTSFSTASTESTVAAVTVTEAQAGAAAAPTFDTDLSTEPVTYIIGDSASALDVAANASDGGVISYQWYSNSTNSTEGGTELTGQTGTSYTPSTSSLGTTYYYVIATNTLGESDATAVSNVAAVTVKAAPVGTVWDGSADTSWYNPADTYFELSTPAQLAGFAQIVSGTAGDIAADSFDGKTVKLTADIDLSSLPWTAIGSFSSNPFAGAFDGNGKKIENINIPSTSANCQGALFAYNTGVIANLTIESGSITANHNYAGAFIARNHGALINCLNRASVSSTSTYVGGLTGINYFDSFIFGCANTGSVTSTSSSDLYLGGITGGCYGIISNSYNAGDVMSANNQGYLGGISGDSYNDGYMGAVLYNCYSSGNVISTDSKAGALIGGAFYDRPAQMSNNLFLQTTAVNSGLYALGDGVAVTDAQVKAVDETALRNAAASLGDDFAADSKGINNSYPVLAWQVSGSYPAPETIEDLSVTAVIAENGKITAILNKKLNYTVLSIENFSVTIREGDGAEQPLEIYSVNVMGNSAALTFEPLPQPAADIVYTIAVGYGAETKQIGSFTMNALSLVSVDSVDSHNQVFGTVIDDPYYEYTEIVLTLNHEPQVEQDASLFSVSYSIGGGTPVPLGVSTVTVNGAVVPLKTDAIPDTTSDRSATVSVSYNGGAAVTVDTVVPATRNWNEYAVKPQNGDGSPSSPYRIGSAEELAWFAALINYRLGDGTPAQADACAVLTADIQLNDTTGWLSWDKDTPGLRVWWPIGYANSVTTNGTYYYAYRGVFDGQGHTINGLYVANSALYPYGFGLFDKANGATIKNLTVDKSYISVVNKASAHIGGILSAGRDVTLENCCTAMRLAGVGGYAGGIAGRVEAGSDNKVSRISGCASSSDITNAVIAGISESGVKSSGGIVGGATGTYNNGVLISDCYFTGSVTGGEAGDNYCFNGGIAGKIEHYMVYEENRISASLSNCYSAGTVGGGLNSAGVANVCEWNTSAITTADLSALVFMTDCYYLSGGAADTYAVPKTEAELKDGAILNLLGDAFNFVAGQNNGYPILKWQTAASATEVAIPTFTLNNSGGLSKQVTFTISCATEGATIYYTTDGSDPTTGSAVYNEPIALENGGVRAFAVKEGQKNSAINAAPVAAVVAPTASPAPFTAAQTFDVAFTSGTADAVIWYTTDGTDPVAWNASAGLYEIGATAGLYSGPVTVSTDTVFKVAALKDGMLPSGSSTFNYPFSWSTDVEQPQGAGTSESPYLIGTSEELAWFAALVNGDLSGTPKNTAAQGKLTADIDLTAHTWKAIKGFTGVFDGDGHTVSNPSFAANAVGSLFESNSGTIKNVGTAGRTQGGVSQGIALLCQSNGGLISGCWNDADIEAAGNHISGLVGNNTAAGVIEFCCNTGDILGKLKYDGTNYYPSQNVGGICAVNSGVVRDCYNTGVFTSMSTYGYLWGGICGQIVNNGSLTRCYNMGMLNSGKYPEANYGDWGGWMTGGYSGLVTGHAYDYSGQENISVTDCYYLENLTLTGAGLTDVPLSRLYWANTNYFAGFTVPAGSRSLIETDKIYYAFYDVSNDQIIGVKLAGSNDDDGYITLDARHLSVDFCFDGSQHQYMSGITKTVKIVTVPANTTHITFTGTEKIQDYTFYLYDNYATKIDSGNVVTVLAQAQSAWPAQYANIAAAINRYLDDVAPPEPIEGQVRVIVENTTFIEPVDGVQPAWTGALVDTWVEIDEESTMMSCVMAALDTVNATQTGAENNYIGAINGLKAFDGGEDSGWMGALNDWFTHTGFGEVTVVAGTLEPGDEIRIMYTQNRGEDLGGTWYNNLKTLKAIAFKAGALSPAFDKDTHTYTLTVPEGTEQVLVTPTATNRNFQVRTYLGIQASGTEYKRTAAIPVSDGAVISVVCGDPAWPSMNNGSYPGNYAENEPAETYTITVQVAQEPVSGFTVGLAAADTGKNPGDTVSVNLNVDGAAGSNSYAALQTVIGYDRSKVSYSGNSFGDAFTVTDNQATGKLVITRVGATTPAGSQGSLSFTVKNDIPTGSGEAVFSVISALVGVSGDPNDPEAATTGADASVNVHNLTVTFTAGANVTMDSVTAYARHGAAGLYTDNFYTTAFSEPSATADSGYTLDSPLWHDGGAQVDYAAIAATAFTANAAYTATATRDLGVSISLPEQVTVISGVVDGKAGYGTDVVFSVTVGPGQEIESVTYTVGSGGPATLTESAGIYTIPGTELTADVTVAVNQQLSGTASFIGFDDYKGAPAGFKVLKFDGSAPEGYKYRYNGTDMYYSGKYEMYVCFVGSDVTEQTALAGISCVEGAAPEINYDGNVNQSGSGLVNVIDAQLVYDLYTTVYLNDPAFAAVSQLMRFAADMNGDGCADTSDVQIIVSLIQNQEL
jgi:hypothetical protein